jgi:hypothetical protein
LAKVRGLWEWLLQRSEREKANLFFGICPRFGKNEQYDLAWQIRVVRVLWADLDHCTVEEALQRCDKAGLPRPSVIVRSGHGVHLYWLLAKPFLIDDAGDPPPVFKDFIDQVPGKKKKVRRYVIDPATKGKVYQYLADPKTGGDSRTLAADFPGDLSPKAERVQHVLAGMAAKIGGDHTKDVARLFRLPCTLNRKDERNGKAPVPCELVECDAGRRYPFADIEKFAEASPVAAEKKQLAAVRLPRRKLTPGRLNKLGDYVNACAFAEDRSRADWKLCRWAADQGLDKEVVWGHVKDVGKFAERGRDYFDLTWDKAEAKARWRVLNRHRMSEPSRNGTKKGAGPPAGAPDRPLEADDDPHRLARLFAADFRAADWPTLRNWQEDFYVWDQGAYRALPPNEVRGLLTQRIKREFDRLNLEAQQASAESGDSDEDGPPKARKVTTRVVNDTLQALAGLTLLRSRVQPPAWLDPAADPDGWEPGKVLACRNLLVSLPAYVQAERYGIPPTPRFFSLNALGYDFDSDAPRPER